MSVSLKRLVRKYLRCWEEFLLAVGNGSLLVPFVIFALLELGLLASVVFFERFPLSYIMVPLIGTISEGRALHYPDHFLLLPSIFNSLNLPFTAVIGFPLFGWGVFMIVDFYDGTSKGLIHHAWMMITRAPSMILIGLVFIMLVNGLPYVLMTIAGNLEGSSSRTFLIWFASICGFVMQALLVYSLLFLKLYGGTAVGSIAKSIRFAGKRFILTLLVVLTIWAMHRPFTYLLSHPNSLAMNFSPENILFILIAEVALGIFTNLFMFSVTAYLALGRRRG